MGAPASLSTSQLDQLQGLTRDAPEIDRDITVGPSGEYTMEVPMRSNDVVLVELTATRDGREQPARSAVIRFGQ
jgi:xylan 1,4-beta-xylosidase